MNLHEYQTKEILKNYHLPIPPFAVAATHDEVINIIRTRHLQKAILKIQVHAGGRGKYGGVKLAHSPQQIEEISAQLLHSKFKNHQTLQREIPVNKILLSDLVDIEKEYYLSLVIDRKTASPVLMISPHGGMDIEEAVEKFPKDLLQISLPHYGKIHEYQLFACSQLLKWSPEVKKQGDDLIRKLIKVFLECDASMLEINPLVLTASQKLSIVDAKMSIDDNSLYRHPYLAQLFDPSQETKEDVLARDMQVSYVSLEGDIGCLVNGAGLAMATMDILNYYGGKAANFLDVGGSASEEQLKNALRLVVSDFSVSVIFINIFGGILDCEVLAKALVSAYCELTITLPIVIRLEGTNVDKGKQILKQSGIRLFFVDSIDEGAKKAVDISKGKTNHA